MNNNTTKHAFPGYNAKQERIVQQEQERVAKALEKANKVKATHVARERKRANSLPPFLMVRSGLLNQWVWPLISCIPLALCGINQEKLSEPARAVCSGISAFFVCMAFGWSIYITPRVNKWMKDDIFQIRNATSRYLKESDYQLDLTDQIDFEKLERILVQHISKHNPGLFDKMMQNPDSVADINVAENIILGHLKSHPDAAQKILDTFDIETMPTKVQRKVNRYANNLRNYMSSQKSR
ncbi:MAG: hypothetical protein J6S80_02125 [Alphaproteobacteria bacterium]|nr:hypothetical protein [Alphaproteobacteria bacterium]